MPIRLTILWLASFLLLGSTAHAKSWDEKNTVVAEQKTELKESTLENRLDTDLVSESGQTKADTIVRGDPRLQDTANLEPVPLQPYFKHDVFTLDNGLRVVVHQDRTVPVVSVMMYAHVGSRHEPEGKTGFAHLFEHLLFNGTPNAPGEFFNHLDELGATNTNGTTDFDRTNYYENVPTGALERTLWLEADRFTNILEGVNEKTLQTQIDVVKNEKGLSDNTPFSAAYYDFFKSFYPANHPYSHSVIGSIEDLENASLDDVRAWFKQYYGARNLVIGLSGDIDVDTAKRLVKKYFGHLRSGSGITQHKSVPLVRPKNTLHVAYDVAPASLFKRSYALPAAQNKEGYMPSLAAELLGNDETSPAYKALVEQLGLATGVVGSVQYNELMSLFTLEVELRPGVTHAKIASALDKVMADYMKKGPSKASIEAYRQSQQGMFQTMLTDAFGKGQILTEGLLYYGDPLSFLRYLNWMRGTTPKTLGDLARTYLSEGYHEEHYIALARPTSSDSSGLWSSMPPISPTREITIPTPEVFKLENGLEVVFQQRSSTPNIEMQYVAPFGTAHFPKDQGTKFGMFTDLLTSSGTKSYSKDELKQNVQTMGGQLTTSIAAEQFQIALTASPDVFTPMSELLADVINNSRYPKKDVELERRLQLEELQKRNTEPEDIGNDIYFDQLSGAENNLSISEQISDLKQVKAEELRQLHSQWIRPDGAKLYVVGDIDKQALADQLNNVFKGWAGSVPNVTLVKRSYPTFSRPKFVLIDKKGASQSKITAFRNTDLKQKDIYLEEVMNNIWGGAFTSRLNLNIREDKGWTYGISSTIDPYPGNSIWGVSGTVTAEHTVDSIKEITREISDARTKRPLTQTELDKTVTTLVDGFQDNLASNFSILSLYSQSDVLKKPYDYFNEYKSRHRAIKKDQVNTALKRLVHSEDLVWLVVGDLSKFEKELKKANLGDVETYSSKGERLD